LDQGTKLLVIFFAGAAGVFLGLAGLIFRLPLPKGNRWKLIPTAGLLLEAAALLAALDRPYLLWVPIALASLFFLSWAFDSFFLGQVWSKFLSLACNPGTQWGILLVGSLALSAWWFVQFESGKPPPEWEGTVRLDSIHLDDLREIPSSPLSTDKGKTVPIFSAPSSKTPGETAEEFLSPSRG